MRHFVEFLTYTGQFCRFLGQTIVLCLRHPPPSRALWEQFYRIGVSSLPVVLFAGTCTGMVLGSHGFFTLEPLGMTNSVGAIVAKTIIVEMGPALTAFMITGRSGAAVAAELGSMTISEQISAIRSMGIDPIWYLVLPRIVAGLLVTPVLTSFCNFFGVVGGYIATVYFFGVSSMGFLEEIPKTVTLFDLFGGLFKASVFGALIFSICCYQGLKANQGAEGVGRVTTQSVVISYIAVLFFNFLMTLLINNMRNFFV